MDIRNLKWTRKEYDVVPIKGEEETGLISGTQKLAEFPSCFGFSIHCIGTYNYILGSMRQGCVCFFRQHIETLEIEELKCEEFSRLSSELFVHSAFVCNERLYVVYNICPQNMNCLLIYDPPTGKCYSIKGDTAASTFRICHTANEYKGQSYFFGGLNDRGELLNSIDILDFTTYRWRELVPHGKIPPPRLGHVSCVLKNNLYIFGGTFDLFFVDPDPLSDMYALDMHSSTWTQLPINGQIPKGKPICLGPIDEGRLLLLWGEKVAIKASLFYIETNTWKELELQGEDTPTTRYGQTGLVTSQCAILLGGFSETEYKDIVYCDILNLRREKVKKD